MMPTVKIFGFFLQTGEGLGFGSALTVDMGGDDEWHDRLRKEANCPDAAVRLFGAGDWDPPTVDTFADLRTPKVVGRIFSSMAVALGQAGLGSTTIQALQGADLEILKMEVSGRALLFQVVDVAHLQDSGLLDREGAKPEPEVTTPSISPMPTDLRREYSDTNPYRAARRAREEWEQKAASDPSVTARLTALGNLPRSPASDPRAGQWSEILGAFHPEDLPKASAFVALTGPPNGMHVRSFLHVIGRTWRRQRATTWQRLFGRPVPCPTSTELVALLQLFGMSQQEASDAVGTHADAMYRTYFLTPGHTA